MASTWDLTYIPEWYRSFVMYGFLGDDGRGVYYYKQKYTFPTILNQWEKTGVLSVDIEAYDGEVWWGEDLWPVSNCVATSVSIAMQIFTYIKTGVKERFSAVWLHGTHSGGEVSALPDVVGGKGAWISDVLNHLRDEGAVPFSKIYPYMCPYCNLQYDTYPPGAPTTAKAFVNTYRSQLISTANKYRISSWNNISKSNVFSVKYAILNYGCCLADIQGTEDFEYVGDNGIIPDTHPYNSLAHSILIIGWETINSILYWKVVNTWGNWGEAGEGGNRTGSAYLPVDHSKIYRYYSMVPYISDTVEWDTPKVAGQPVVVNAIEMQRMMQRLKYVLEDNYNTYFTPYDFSRHKFFHTYQYNQAVGAINAVRSSTLTNVSNSTSISAAQLNDLRDYINAFPT